MLPPPNSDPNGNVKGLWCEAALLPDGWAENVALGFANGVITTVTRDCARPLGAKHCTVALPGLPNLHSHAFQRGMAGLAEVRGASADSFWTWREVMYHFLDRLAPSDVEAISALAYAEMLEAGFTRVGEFHYLHNDPSGRPYDNPAELSERIFAAAESTGIHLTFLPSFYAHADFGGAAPTPGQRRFIATVDRFARLVADADRLAARRPGTVVGVAPHSLRAVAAGEFREIIALGQGRPIHIHAAEQEKEVADCLAATGARPVRWLLAHVPLDHHWCVIHATHLTPEELNGLAASGATVGLCPITEANLGDGVFPAADYVALGGHLGVGTDSNVQIDAFAELRQLEYSQRLTQRRRNLLAASAGSSTARSLFERALAGGARALQQPGGLGLVIGAPADVVALTGSYADLAPREGGDTILDRLVFGGGREGAVDRVWVRGNLVVQAGRHLRRTGLAIEFRRTLRRLLTS